METTTQEKESTMLEISFPVDLRQIAPMMTTFVGFGGIAVTTQGTSFGVVEVEDILSGKADPIEVRATQDGRGFIRQWASADEDSGDSVYAEVYTAEGRTFHGWIDRASRKIVQTG